MAAAQDRRSWRPRTAPLPESSTPASARDVAVRALVVDAVALLAAVGVLTLVLQGWGGLSPDAADVVPLLVHPVLVALAVAWVGRLVPRSWWAPGRARWAFAGLVTVAASVILFLLLWLVTALIEVGGGRPLGAGLGVDTALAFTGVGSLLSGLPVWTLFFGALVGPGTAPAASSTGALVDRAGDP